MYFTFHDFMAHKTNNIFQRFITHYDSTHSPYMRSGLRYDKGVMELSTQQTPGSVERAHPWIWLNKGQAWPHYHALTCYFFESND